MYILRSMERENLKERREQIGLTQTEFAEIIGVTSTTISRYETGLMKIPKYMDFVLEALEMRLIKKLQQPSEK